MRKMVLIKRLPFLLFAFAVVTTSVRAQLSVTITGTNGTCQSDASVKAGTKGAVAPITFELRNSSNVVIRPGQPDSNFTGLPPATYKVAVYDANHPSVPVISSNLAVSTSYSALAINSVQPSAQSDLPFSCTSNSLAGYSYVSWSYTGKGPYTLSVLSGPTIPTSVQIPAGSYSGRISNLSSGSYIFSLTDACNSTVSTNTVTVAGTAGIYPASFNVSVLSFYPTSVTTCGKGLDIYMNVTASGGSLSAPVRMYAEFPANSGNFTDTVTNNRLNVIFSSALTPAQINNAQFNVWVQQPCTGTWQKNVFTIPDNSMAVASSVPFIVPNNCDSIIPYITVSFPRNNVSSTTPVYCYPIRFTVAKATDPGTILKDTSINSGGFSNYGMFYQPVTSGTYIVKLTDANGYQEQQILIITATSPKKLSYAASADPSDCNLSSQYLMVAGNSFLQDGPYPVTLRLIMATGLPDLSVYPPIVISSFPNNNNWINLWKIPLLPDNATVQIEATWSCPRKDTGYVSTVYLQKKYPYSSIKLDSSWYTVGTAGCSGNKANVGLRIAVKDTLGKTIPNYTGSFVIKVLSPGGINQQYFSSGIQQNVFANVSPGTYTIAVAPNMPPFTGTPPSCAYWDTIKLTVPVFGLPSVNTTQTYGVVCPGQTTGSLTIVANGYPPFKYAIRKQGDPSFGSQQSSNIFTGLAPGYYDVQLQDGCNNIVVQTVQVINLSANSLLTVSGATASGAVCAGGRVVMRVKPIGPVTSITWTLSDGSTVSNIDSIVVTNFDASKAGNYSVVVVSGAGCTVSDTRTLSLGAPVNLIVTDPAAICTGSSIDLTNAAITAGSSNIASLSYYTDAAAKNAVANPASVAPAITTTYYIKAISPDSCIDLKPVTVTVASKPAISTVNTPLAICAGDNLFISGGLVVPTVNNNSSPITTSGWYLNGVLFDPTNVPFTANGKALTYIATNACGTTTGNSVLLTVNDVALLTPNGPLALPACSGSLLTVSAPTVTQNGLPVISAKWYLNNVEFNPAVTLVTTADNGKTLKYEVVNNCGIASMTQLLVVNALPVVNPIMGNTSLCVATSVNLNDVTPDGVWGSSNTSIAAVDASGKVTGVAPGTTNIIYTVTGTGGCATTVTIPVTVNPTPTVNAVTNQISCADNAGSTSSNKVTFTGSDPAAFYNWTMTTNIGYVLSGTGDIPSFAYILPAGSAAVTSSVTVTPIANGCIGVKSSFNYTLNPYPQPAATVNNTTQCLTGNNFSFTNTTSIPGNTPLTYQWNFDDGGSATTTNVSHAFTIAGDHTYTITATSDKGCSRSYTGTVSVKPQPTASFTYVITSPNTNDTYTFTNTSTSPSGTAGMSYYWDFGDGTFATGVNPVHTYAADGSYTVKLTVTTADGCSASVSQVITVKTTANLIAGFTINNAGQCVTGNSFAFTNTSTASGGVTITGYSWNFGDGGTSTAASPSHTYAAPGSYTVRLSATSSTGFTDVVTQSVNVYVIPDVKQPANIAVCNGTYIGPILFSSSAGNPSYTWTNDNTQIGLYASGSGNIPFFPGYYFNMTSVPVVGNITVTPSQNGCIGASKTFTITLNPLPDITALFQCVCAQNSTSEIVLNSAVPGTTITWTNDNTSIGLAASGTGNVPAFTAINTGSYQQTGNITVRATSGAGCTAYSSIQIGVTPKPKLTSPSIAPGICSGTTFDYSPAASIPEVVFNWSRAAVTGITQSAASGTGNISEVLTNTTNAPIVVSYIYALTSSPNCTFTSVDLANCTYLDTIQVTVYPVPVVTPPADLNVCNGSKVDVVAFNSNVSVVNYVWGNNNVSIGLGANGSGNIPSFTALNASNAIVTATISVVAVANYEQFTLLPGTPLTPPAPPVLGCVSAPQDFTITVNPFITAGKLNDTTVCPGTQVTMPAFSSNGPAGTVFNWTIDQNIGMPLSGSGNIPVFTATNNTNAPVTANVTVTPSVNTCASNAVTSRITVNPVIAPAFAINATPQCLSGNVFTFTNQTVPANGVDYLWDFGDGTISTEQSSTHVYLNAGTYTVTLNAVNAGSSCASVAFTKDVVVNVMPNASFIYSIISPNTNNSYQFTSLSSISAGNIVSYAWDFGDGAATSTLQNPTHTYTAAGTYPVVLTVTSNNGCTASITQTVTVTIDPNLIAAFTINDNAQCITGNNFQFTNTSTISNGALISGYLWDFGDGTTSTDEDPPVHVYATAGNYVVKLTATSNTGYSDIATKSITVYPTPEMEDPADVVVCSGSNTPVIRYKPIIPGLTFTWTNDHPEIGLAASGSGGSVPSFTTTNTTNNAIVATITVVPHANGCDGIPQTFTITVNPIPTVSGYTNLAPCAGNAIFPISFTSNVSGATFNWSNDNSTIGIPASGSGSLPSVIALNNGIAPVVATITVTPQANACTGTPQTFTITVNPLPVMTSSTAATAICSGATFHYTPQSSTTGVTFSWSRATVAGISNAAASGTGDPNEVLVNTTTAPVTVNYIYSLTANGCNGAATYTIPVTVNPTASLNSTLTPPAICDNTRFSYIPASATTGTAFTWTRAADAYNAAASGIGNPFEVLHNGGTTPLTVTYTYTASANSCTGSTQNVQVVVNPTPNDDFTSNGPQCLNGNNFVFTLSPNSGAASYGWTFGDGTTASGTNPSHTYTIDGLYPVTLNVTSATGCTNTVQHLVLVQPSPVAQFVYNTIAPNSNDEYQFTDQSIIGSGALASYNWDFGDGNTSTVQNPTHAYTASGTYTVTLTVTSVLGCSATITQTLIVNKDPNVIAGFTINDASQCISGNSFVFTDATTTAAGITVTGYTWDFGDGTPVSNLQSPTHNYAAAGNYVVKLHVTGTDGVSTFADDITQTVIVFATPDMVQPGDQAVCNQSATAPVIFKPIQPGLSFNWTMNTDIGGGTSGSGNIASFTANNAGNAPVTATVSVTPVANGCSGTVKTFSIVVNPTPTVGGYANQSVCAGSNIAAVNFTSNVSGATYTWINNNTTTGIAASGNNMIPSTTGVNSGIAPEVSTITVVPSANGCNGTPQTFTVTVNPIPVMTSSTDGGTICSGTVFHYTPQSTTAGANFSWSRAAVTGITEAASTGTGDPNETLTNATALPITVTYLYTVNANTCNSASTYNVQVIVNPAATLSSALNAPPICSGNVFSYLPTSATPGTGYNWSRAAVAGISNASATGTGNPNETLINTTNLPITVPYAYTLTANGCASTTQNVTVVVNPLPVADFTMNLPIQCLSNNSYVFTNTSSIGSGTLSYAWDLDDGTTATTQDVTHVYQAEGVYNISLTTTTSDGCSATVNKTVQVNPSPVAGFTYNITSPNSDDTFQFTNTSIISSGLLTSYLWDFGDNSSSTEVLPQHIYATDSTYTVMLIVTSALGCTDLTTQSVIVSINPNIVPGFTINNATQCVAGNNFIFTNTTTARNPNTLIYSWNFGDGSSLDSSINPTHTYAAPGVYIVTLTVTGPRGYVAELTQSVVAFPTPTVLKPLDQTLCNGTNTRNINFVGGITSTTFNWTNDHPEIGLPATGSGNILSFKGTNTTNVPIVATITITPLSNGCSGTTQTFTITVNPTPNIDLVTDQSLCAGQSTTAIHFTGNVTGTTFRWLNNNTAIGLAAAGAGDIPSFTVINNSNIASTATIMVAPFTATCFGTAQRFTINVNPLPSLTSTTTPKAICDSAVFNYEPSSNVTGTVFNWSRAAVAGISNASAIGTGNPDELLDNTTALPVLVTYAYVLSVNGCSSTTQNVMVTVNPRPKLTSDAILSPICDSTQFSYTPTSSTPGTAFDWIRVAVPGISNPAAYGKDNPNETLDNNTTVPVNVTYAYTLSADKCYNTYNVNVAVNPKLALTGNTTPTPVCSGTAFQYTPTGTATGSTYSWSRAAVAGISNPAATGTGNINETLINTTASAVNVTYAYTLSYNGCTATYNITVTVNPAPSLTVIPVDQAVCAGKAVNNIPLSGSVAGTMYNWTNSNTEIGLAASGTGTIASFITNNPHIEAIGGRISVDPVTPAGCKMAVPATFVILVNSTPQGNIAAPLGTTVCSGSAIPLIATGGATYQWYKDGNLMPGATNAQLPVVAAGTYSVSAITSAGCSVQQAGNVKVAAIEKPKADFDFSGYCVNVPVTFTDKSTTASSGVINYLWTDNAGNISTAQSPVITYTQAVSVIMKLKVTPQLCPLLADSLSKTLAIEVPQAGQTLPLVNTTVNAATQLNARNIGNNSYLWIPSTGLNNTTIQNPIATLAASQQYRINMGMPSGCTVTDTLQVTIRGNEEVFIPNMITPNGDGKNDQLIIVGMEKYPNSTMIIFNRWGNEVYRSNNYDNKWDGSGLLEGTYFYSLKLRLPSGEVKEFKGWILLSRGNGQ